MDRRRRTRRLVAAGFAAALRVGACVPLAGCGSAGETDAGAEPLLDDDNSIIPPVIVPEPKLSVTPFTASGSP